MPMNAYKHNSIITDITFTHIYNAQYNDLLQAIFMAEQRFNLIGQNYCTFSYWGLPTILLNKEVIIILTVVYDLRTFNAHMYI